MSEDKHERAARLAADRERRAPGLRLHPRTLPAQGAEAENGHAPRRSPEEVIAEGIADVVSGTLLALGEALVDFAEICGDALGKFVVAAAERHPGDRKAGSGVTITYEGAE
jgi:hypothetical protein